MVMLALFISRPEMVGVIMRAQTMIQTPDFHGTVHSFQFQTRHADVVGFDNAFKTHSRFVFEPRVILAFLLMW